MLTSAQKKHLKALAHKLKPVVMVGGHGLTANVLAELDIALSHHELVKVRLAGEDRDEKAALISSMASEMEAELVQRIGHVAVLFRRNEEKPKVKLS